MNVRHRLTRSCIVVFSFYVLHFGAVATAAALSISVNYTEERAWGTAGPSASVDVMLTDSAGAVKETATASANDVGEFSVEHSEWVPDGCDDNMYLGDFVYAQAGTTITSVRIGGILAEADPAVDRVAGTVQASWLSGSATVFCAVTEPDAQVTTTVDPNGGFFTCDFGNAGRDVRPGEVVQVGYAEPDGDQVWRAVYVPGGLHVIVNYGWDQVSGGAPPDTEVSVGLKDGSGTVKATAQVVADSEGTFETLCSDWSPSSTCPDIIPGDVVEVGAGDFSAQIQVGDIDGSVDVAGDLVAGTVTAPFAECVTVTGEIPEEAVEAIQTYAFSEGGNYTLDFSGLFDLLPGHWVLVSYQDPDRNWVSNIFGGRRPHLVIDDFQALGNAGESGNLTLNISYVNLGNAVAETSQITLILENMSYLSDTSGLNATTTSLPEAQQVTWDLGDLVGDAGSSFQIFVSVDGAVSDALTATAEISTSNQFDQGEPDEKQRVWSGVIATNSTYLAVSTHSWTNDPAPGTDFIWEVVVCNSGDTGSSEVTLIDVFPADTSFVTWWANDPGWQEVAKTSEQLSITVPTIPGGSCRSIYLKFHVSEFAMIDTGIVNTVEASAASDLSGGAAAVQELFTGVPHANLTIQKSWLNGQLTPGGDLHYMIECSNTGNVPVAGYEDADGDPVVLAVVDTLPAHTSFIEASLVENGWSFPVAPLIAAAEAVVFQFPDLENGYQRKLEVTAQVDQDAAPETILVNTAEICLFNTVDAECLTEPIAEDTYEDNIGMDTQVVRDHGQNLRVSKKHEWLSQQQELDYRIRFENIGDEAVSSVSVRDTYPYGTIFNGEYQIDTDAVISGFTHETNLITWSFEALEPGQSGTIRFTVALSDSSAMAEYTNSVEILPGEDTNPADNFAEDVAVRRDIGSVHIKLDEQVVLGTAVPGKNVTVTTPQGQLQAETWECPEGHFYPEDISLGGCWSVDTGTIVPGDVVKIDCDQHSVTIEIPDPFEAYASSVTDLVSGRIDNLDTEWVRIRVGLGADVVEEAAVQTDDTGFYSATFTDIPAFSWAEVIYTTMFNYAETTFHRLVTCDRNTKAMPGILLLLMD